MGLTAAAAIVGMASAASADEMTGTVKEIENIIVTDAAAPDQEKTFAVSDTNTVGATLDDLKEGDQVTIFYADSDSESGMPINAMQIDKVEE
jgi:hypothetical protein